MPLDGLRKADADILDLHDVVDRKLGHIAAHVRPLQAERRAVLRALVDQTLAEVSRIGRGLVPGDKGSQFALDPDELDAALRHIDVVLEEFLGEAGRYVADPAADLIMRWLDSMEPILIGEKSVLKSVVFWR
mgnify:CR=1 FL=1